MAATNSLERALAALKLIERTPGGLRNADLGRLLNIPKSTCSYILARLEREGYVIRDAASGHYKIGLATVALAHGALREVGVRTVAEPALYKLTSDTGLSAGIGVLQAGRVLLVDRVEGPEFVNSAVEAANVPRARYRGRAQRDIGRELPLHSTALGKVLLAYLPRAEAAALVAQAGLARHTPRTITSKSRFLAELDTVLEQGWALADGEELIDLKALAAPIFDDQQTVRAAVSVNGSPRDPVWNDLEDLVRQVAQAGRDISRRARF
jgi:DNA-binding IclR family transcriptional regulator